MTIIGQSASEAQGYMSQSGCEFLGVVSRGKIDSTSIRELEDHVKVLALSCPIVLTTDAFSCKGFGALAIDIGRAFRHTFNHFLFHFRPPIIFLDSVRLRAVRWVICRFRLALNPDRRKIRRLLRGLWRMLSRTRLSLAI